MGRRLTPEEQQARDERRQKARINGLTPETFWDGRPALSLIRNAAQARGVGRWAVLAACLARIATLVPVTTVLPGPPAYASLNYFVVIAAESSGGKSAAQALARELVAIDGVPTLPLSTGQGITAQFVKYVAAKPGNKKEDVPPVAAHLERVNTSVLFSVDEIGDIAAKTSSGGNNLMPVIRTAWGAEVQGSSTATRDNNLHLEPHTYRMGLIINTQLGASRFLLSDSDTGTPQRFLFVPAVDNSGFAREQIMNMPLSDLALSGEAVEPIEHDLALQALGETDLAEPYKHPVRVCATARLTSARNLTLGNSGFDPEYPAHHLLNRLKTACLLSFLCGENGDVTEEFWALAGIVMAVSENTKKMLAEHAEREEREEAEKRGRNNAIVQEAQRDAEADAEEKKLANARVRTLSLLRERPMTRREFQQKFNKRTRAYAMQALEILTEEGIAGLIEDKLVLLEDEGQS